MQRFNSILIANRGEIACRIIRTAKSMGYRTIAVYSEADAGAPHMLMADQAVLIGRSPVAESYLRGDLILSAAQRSNAEAIHPGYGFLSENPVFARAVTDAGLVFIGPSADAIELMGNKAAAKRRMIAAGVPCVPGYEGEDQGDKTLLKEASRIGLPLMVKAAAGGGGRGMRLVEDDAKILPAINMARAEAESAFGCGDLILEKAIVRPRHVEFQVFADTHGNTIHLGERDCSVQRRHQKVVEEAPCPVMTTALRERMGEAAVAAARSIAYVGAGTVEFLLDETGDFYFLEMNTRLQVEHPVTELITGLDLVSLQIRVAQGEPMPISQADVELTGHAIEVRLYTEDPARDFMPTSGTVERWSPPDGTGIRVDAGISTGQIISPFYDPMVAKIIAYGSSRDIARLRLIEALNDTVLFGPRHNGAFLIFCLSHARFARGEATTAFITEEYNGAKVHGSFPDLSHSAVAATIEYLLDYEQAHRSSVMVSPELQGWSSASAVARTRSYDLGASAREVRVTPRGSLGYQVVVEEKTIEIEVSSFTPCTATLLLDGLRKTVHYLRSDSGTLYLSIDGSTAEFKDSFRLDADSTRSAADGQITAPLHGVILELSVSEGDSVEEGQPLAVLEAMKMHYEIVADTSGEVKQVFVEIQNQVSADQLLIEIAVHE